MDEPRKSHQEEHAAARRVLVVDDSVDVTRMMELVLEPEGFEVRSAHDGPEAIEAARSQLPDVVLLDVGLPTMGGVEVAMELRITAGLEDALIVAVTGHGDEVLPDPSPFDHHLMKPVDPDRLVRLLTTGGRPTQARPPGREVIPLLARR